MGIFDLFVLLKQDAGTRAYRAHVSANRLSDKGKTAESEKMYDKAAELYARAEENGFTSTRIVTGYCVLLMRRRQFDKAKAMIAELCADPSVKEDDKYLLRIDHVVCRWKTGDIDGAIEELRGLSAKKTGLYFNVMSSMLVEKARATGDYAEAEEFCKSALDYDDDDIIILNSAGWLKYFTGDGEAAKSHFKKALNDNPRYAPALTGIAQILHDSGKDDKAREFIDRALAVHYPTSTPVDRAFAEDLKKKIG